MNLKRDSCEFMEGTVNPISYPVPKTVFKRIEKNARNLVKKMLPPAISLIYRKIRLKFFSNPERLYLNPANDTGWRMKVLKNNFSDTSFRFENLNLQPGEWIEVRSLEEIRSTFDGSARLKGLGFMLGMEDYCGKKFKVYKRVRKIRLETNGDMRKLKNPAILLEGVFCDGKHYEGCDRSCFYFWREAWLKRISDVKQLILYITSYVFVETGIDNCCSMLIS